ncbi:family 10 glycosylhydrolase, partial [Patescibacteria group bacterium]|nr:family 10 glycosylhydrolase [Patescibacteria group bacterium]
NHLLKKHPGWIVKNRSDGRPAYWLDPGLPEVRNHLVLLITELVRKYDLNGVQLDFIRYPNGEFNDEGSYSVYGAGKSRDDWRRENLTLLVDSLYKNIKRVNPFVKVGATPIGIYKNIPGAEGMEGFNDVFQDSRLWLEKGIVDYLVPQIYWAFEGNPKFDKLVEDWTKNSYGRNVVIGLALYKPEVMKVYLKSIETSREFKASGIAFFRYSNTRDLPVPIFPHKTFPADMNWIDASSPSQPQDLAFQIIDEKQNKIKLNWSLPPGISKYNDIEYFAIYNLENEEDMPGSDKLLKILPAERNQLTFSIKYPEKINYYLTMSSVDELWNESPSYSNTVMITIPSLKRLSNEITLTKNPVMIKRADESKLIIYSVFEDELEIDCNESNLDGESVKEKIFPGINVIALPGVLNKCNTIKISYKNSQKNAILRNGLK